MIVKKLGLQKYKDILQQMQIFTQNRDINTPNELWLVEFDSIFTTGIKKNNYPDSINNISVIKTDRGGQITYHGKGQIIIYLLLDLKKIKIGVKKLVGLIEDSIINLLLKYNIKAHKRANMPGVYVNNKKIASLGLKIKNNKTYHGLSLNTNMDLTPFSYIFPCGYNELEVCQISDFIKIDTNIIAKQLIEILKQNLTKN